MKRIFMNNIPQVGNYDIVVIDIYTEGEALDAAENNEVDYNDLDVAQQLIVDNYIAMMFNNLKP